MRKLNPAIILKFLLSPSFIYNKWIDQDLEVTAVNLVYFTSARNSSWSSQVLTKMDLIVPLIFFRYIEVVIDLLNILIYFCSGTVFGFRSGNTFGEFVLIAGFILAVTLLLLDIFLEIVSKYHTAVLIYHLVQFVLFLAIGIYILSTWTDAYFHSSERSSGIAVGFFCILLSVILLIGGYCIYDKHGIWSLSTTAMASITRRT